MHEQGEHGSSFQKNSRPPFEHKALLLQSNNATNCAIVSQSQIKLLND